MRPPAWPPETLQEAMRLDAEGLLSLAEIGKRIGKSADAVWQKLRRRRQQPASGASGASERATPASPKTPEAIPNEHPSLRLSEGRVVADPAACAPMAPAAVPSRSVPPPPPEDAFEVEEEHDLRGWQDYKPRPAMSIVQPGRVTDVPVKRRVIIGDVHCKYQDRRVEAVGLSIIREFAPHSIWQIGDLLDCEAVSDFGQQRLAWDTLAAEQYEANLFLDRVQSAAPSGELVILGGNHDDPGPEGRPGKYAAKHPEAGLGICNTPVELYIEPREYNRPGSAELRGATYIRVAKQPFRDGLSAMFHGIGWESAGYAKLIADRYIPANCHGVHVLYGGHMHGLASASGVAGGIYQCIGWWGDRSHEVVTYKKKKGIPADWHNAIVLEESSEHSVHYQVVRIVNGAALFSGRVFAAKAA